MKHFTLKKILIAILFCFLLFSAINIKNIMRWISNARYKLSSTTKHHKLYLLRNITPMAGSYTLLKPKDMGQFIRADHLILFNNRLFFPFEPLPKNKTETNVEFRMKINPPFIVLHPKTFSICNYTQSAKYYSSIAQMDGITLIFAQDKLMNHFFHFFEHLLPTFAGIQELYNSNAHQSVSYALFPNMDGTFCVGKYNLNRMFLRLLWPNINIICGQEMKDMSAKMPFSLQHTLISMRTGIPGVPCNESPTCIWNKMNGAYMHIIKKHSISFAKTVLSNLMIRTSNMPHFKEISTRLKYRMCYISRENSRRNMQKSVRKLFLKIRELHSYFGNKRNLFDFLVLRLEDYFFEEQIAVISTCNLIISIHGNGLSHVLWMAFQSKYPNAKLVVELLPGENNQINDFLLQSEFAHAYHIQWDISKDQIRSGSLDFGNFSHCPIQFYQFLFHSNVNADIENWSVHGIYHMFDAVQSVWKFIVKDGHIYGMDPSELREELNDNQCIGI